MAPAAGALGKVMQASKWIKVQALLDGDEMAELLDALPDFALYKTGVVVKRGDQLVDRTHFLTLYRHYIDALKEGKRPDAALYRAPFSSSLSQSIDCFAVQQVADDKELLRTTLPVIQMQYHTMNYSKDDLSFHPMVFGNDAISWGIQFSYPHLYQDPSTGEIVKTDDSDRFPNTAGFRTLSKWIRGATIPTPFLIGGKRVNAPMRLGKQALSWIKQHPDLLAQEISVDF